MHPIVLCIDAIDIKVNHFHGNMAQFHHKKTYAKIFDHPPPLQTFVKNIEQRSGLE